jgi:alpha-beta hydrolase superfamily lysophospholipase
MTLVDQQVPIAHWNEPEGVTARGTLIVIPGRGEQPSLYERFGRRLAADAYRVRAVADPAATEELATVQVTDLLADPDTPGPRVLVGSDTGALFAVGLVASGALAGIDALVLAGLPATGDGPGAGSWDDELDTRTSCPTHRARLAASELRRGALYEPIPDGWIKLADLGAVGQPVLGIHGADDQVSPLAAARARYAAAASATLVSIRGGQHDALNDQTHRSVAATIVLFLERLRLGAGLPTIVVSEQLSLAGDEDRS